MFMFIMLFNIVFFSSLFFYLIGGNMNIHQVKLGLVDLICLPCVRTWANESQSVKPKCPRHVETNGNRHNRK